ncbi:TetR/AcrR family transcriptional regulator [Rhodococcus chondri]|uniref:TetR/AcrR family transcriptional regulator n=1 Tax=Rhodococcus chondri TaxID=3065941 RepID=A0ABU7JMK3_9NOCA|nr:TetR/AcrR family transcriptional regulator [Rhodococcus sp. CC-R104]MEE2031260.1 TetR/AcrR family transcriptional regulator [Rhodococcus sp. CC-R104]
MAQPVRATPSSTGVAAASGSKGNGDGTTPVPVQSLSARGKRTRAALIQAARDAFEEVGLNEARVADITRRAEVSYGSFYTYFESKEEIFREVVKQVTGEMFEASAVGDAAGSSPRDRLAAANRRYLQAYERNARIMGLIEEVAPYDSYSQELLKGIRGLFLGRIENGVRHQQKDGRLDPDLDPRVVARILGGMIEQVARLSFIQGEPYDEDVVVHTLTTLWSNAVGSVPDE